MTLGDIEDIIHAWAPTWVAMEHDNVGIQIGDRKQTISSVLLALDPTPQVVDEAIRKHVDLVITHHPLFFRPPKNLLAQDPIGNIALTLARHSIALFSAHTNLDFTEDGVSHALASTLGLKNVRFLSPLKGTLSKIVVFVPEAHADQTAAAMANAGAGVIGNYTNCSFRSIGVGTFFGGASATPYVEKAGNLEHADEVRLEMIAPRARLQSVVAAMRSVHPYEEPAYDCYNLENSNVNAGMGAIGSLPAPMTLERLLTLTSKKLGAPALRYSGNPRSNVTTVAVCGGSGGDLLEEAIRQRADVLITADVRYHAYHQAAKRIALIDAGHYETEHLILPVVARYLSASARQRNSHLRCTLAKNMNNPIHYFVRRSTH